MGGADVGEGDKGSRQLVSRVGFVEPMSGSIFCASNFTVPC
jgi:hypothetical protein